MYQKGEDLCSMTWENTYFFFYNPLSIYTSEYKFSMKVAQSWVKYLKADISAS